MIDTLFDDTVYFSKWVEYTDLVSKEIEKKPSDKDHGTMVSSIIVDGPALNPDLDDECGRFRVKHFGVVAGKSYSSFTVIRAIKDIVETTSMVQTANPLLCVLCGLITFLVVTICSVYGKKTAKLIPFIIGILAGYAVAAIFTVIGIKTNDTSLQIINFEAFKAITPATIFAVPKFTSLEAIKNGGFSELDGSYIASIAMAYIPVAFVVFAEHIADHKNISSIINKDLLDDPGLHRTLLGDGVGSMVGAFFGGCPNTTYGESIACVAITGNASVATILTTAIMAIAISFFNPFVIFLGSIPNCVMGGVCMALYGFIAVSGLKMIKNVDLDDNRNLFVVSSILIAGIGGLALTFGKITITSIATALILGIIVNLILSKKGKKA